MVLVFDCGWMDDILSMWMGVMDGRDELESWWSGDTTTRPTETVGSEWDKNNLRAVCLVLAIVIV